jgi:hypothetical protein
LGIGHDRIARSLMRLGPCAWGHAPGAMRINMP